MAQLLFESKRSNVSIDITSQTYLKTYTDQQELLQEWEAIQACKGKHIQQAIDIDLTGKTIRFEYDCDSYSLLDLKQNQRHIFVQQLPNIIKAIGHCHKCGWVHGDIKPSNIIYSPISDNIRVIDFGSSQRIGTSRNELETWECTVEFARELIKRGEGSYQPADDWYALNKIIDQFIVSNVGWYVKIRARIYKKLIMRKLLAST